MKNAHKILHFVASPSQFFYPNTSIKFCKIIQVDLLSARIPNYPLSLTDKELHSTIIAVQEMCRLWICRQLTRRNQKSICKMVRRCSRVKCSQHRSRSTRMHSISSNYQIARESCPIRKCNRASFRILSQTLSQSHTTIATSNPTSISRMTTYIVPNLTLQHHSRRPPRPLLPTRQPL
jgi:hypothetical protein